MGRPLCPRFFPKGVSTVVLTNRFATIVCKQLNGILPAGKWRCNGRIGLGREVVDLCGTIADGLVYVEVELRRDEPLTNVVKIWRAIEQDSHTNEVILVQAFSGHYRADNTHRLNAEFIGKHMEASCGARYVPLSFPFRPSKGATVVGDYRRRAAASLASGILEALQVPLIHGKTTRT